METIRHGCRYSCFFPTLYNESFSGQMLDQMTFLFFFGTNAHANFLSVGSASQFFVVNDRVKVVYTNTTVVFPVFAFS